VSWDAQSQRCVSDSESGDIDGDTFQHECWYFGTYASYYPLTPEGLIDVSSKALKVDIALGQCFD
ncbi:hypothetical protein E4U56_004799, partial [Claviceps arundinis]